jgi:hypothetical protein
MIRQGVTQIVNTSALNVQMGIPSQVNYRLGLSGLMDDVRFYNVSFKPVAECDGWIEQDAG